MTSPTEAQREHGLEAIGCIQAACDFRWGDVHTLLETSDDLGAVACSLTGLTANLLKEMAALMCEPDFADRACAVWRQTLLCDEC